MTMRNTKTKTILFSANRIRLKENHARENRGCIQTYELGFSGRAVETKPQLSRSLKGEEEEESSCQIVAAASNTAQE